MKKNLSLKLSYKIIAALVSIFLLSSCLSSKADDPLILPPNFFEKPDPNNPEKPSEEQKDESITRLKELLLQSD